MNSIIILTNPMGAVRQTKRDVWKKRPCVLKYREYRDILRGACSNFVLSDNFEVLFYIAIPESWSKKKKARMFMQPHDQKPDIDNLIKAVMDALKPEDKAIWKVSAEKRWNTYGAVEITNNEVK
jgi:Holliday junction resolvase RusA-like endonuclease